LRLEALVDSPRPHGDEWIAELIERAFRTAQPELICATTAAAATAFAARGDLASARAATIRGASHLSSLGPYWLFDAVAEFASNELAARGRATLENGLAAGKNPGAAAHVALFDARVARRGGANAEAAGLAHEAQRAFEALSWPVEAAAALEVGGDARGALAAYRALGATREVRRLEDLLGERPAERTEALGLSPREEQIARLVARGYSNLDVAERLGIGERTVETHVTSAYRKLGIRNRTELVARLADTQA